jgi:hypothetical protein
MRRRRDGRINRRITFKGDVYRICGAAAVDRTHRVVDRRVNDCKRARLQDRVRWHRRRADRDDVPFGHHVGARRCRARRRQCRE